MYNWDLTKLNGYDYYLYGMYMYDHNPYNLYYVVNKAALFSIETVPEYEMVNMYFDFIRTMSTYLLQEQKTLEDWVTEYSKKHTVTSAADPELPEAFKKLFAKLSGDENTGS